MKHKQTLILKQVFIYLHTHLYLYLYYYYQMYVIQINGEIARENMYKIFRWD